MQLSLVSGFNIICIDPLDDHLLVNLEYLDCYSVETIKTPLPGKNLLHPPYLLSLKHLKVPDLDKICEAYPGFFWDLKEFCPALDTLSVCWRHNWARPPSLESLAQGKCGYWQKARWMLRAIREGDLRFLTHASKADYTCCSIAVKITYQVKRICRSCNTRRMFSALRRRMKRRSRASWYGMLSLH